MPAKNKPKRTTRNSRKNIKRREGKKKSGCKKRTKPAAKNNKVIANSLFALTLSERKQEFASDIDKTTLEEYTPVMYKDLVQSYNHAARFFEKEPHKPDYKKKPIDGVKEVMAAFRTNILPDGFEVNIDEHHTKKANREGYHFCIYKECSIPDGWMDFELKPLIEKLAIENKKLHDFFIQFMAAFVRKLNLPGWFNGGMTWAEHHIEEHVWNLEERLKYLKSLGKKPKEIQVTINNEHDEDEDEDETENIQYLENRINNIKNECKEYSSGKIATVSKVFNQTKTRSLTSLQKSISRFNPKDNLVIWMKKALQFMERKTQLGDFCYENENGEMEDYLRFDQQVTVIWSWEDHLTGCYREIIDSITNGVGMYSPMLHCRIFPSELKIDWDAFLNSTDWPLKLHLLWGEFNDIIEPLIKDYNER